LRYACARSLSKVEVRASSPLVQTFGLQRLDFVLIDQTYPQLARALAGVVGAAFESHFNEWVNVTAPSDFDLEATAKEVGARKAAPEEGKDASFLVEGDEV